MNISRSGFVVALLSAVYAFPSPVFATGEPTGSPAYTEVSNCSELTRSIDKKVCRQHLPVFEKLIREKNTQTSPTTASTGSTPTPETVRIIKIAARTTRPGLGLFETSQPTLFIFDAEQVPGKGQQAIYELPLPEAASGSDGLNSFRLPENSAFVGNRTDVLPEFVIVGGIEKHYVMSAPDNDSVYYLANIEVNSRNPLSTGGSSATTSRGESGPTPTTKPHIPAGILDLKGAGIFIADNVKIVLDPADNRGVIKPVKLGCTRSSDMGSGEHFIYRFTHSEFDLLQGIQGETHRQNAAVNVECSEKTGQVHLTMKNTKTVITVPTDAPTPAFPESSGVLFSFSLSPRENVLRFVDSTCNSVVDQHGNDLSVDSANPWDPDHYIGGIWHINHCSDIHTIDGAFGLKNNDLAWGLITFDHADQDSCSSTSRKSYRAGYAAANVWSAAGVDVACNCTMPTSASSTSSASSSSPYTTQAPILVDDAGNSTSLIMNNTGAALKRSEVPENSSSLTPLYLGLGLSLGDLTITQAWFHLSKRIQQARVRHTSQVLALVFGLGLPALQLIPQCVSGLRSKKSNHIQFTNLLDRAPYP
ncbi:hypothetical protein [Endozoicomonas sp. 4G]|uniref:hypothetical protein n=1 Tax=Endozoicomonas sp. 4G TaxID=2872754 RepID=UPI002078EC6A|nr:hypothetical protein [Endozoicomonas sp. 4G]